MTKNHTIPSKMTAMLCQKPGVLEQITLATPQPASTQLLLKVIACGVCRTDLHLLEGELPEAQYPIIPGHQVVGLVVQVGTKISTDLLGQMVGVPWLGSTCQHCTYCQNGQENLCDSAKFVGSHLNGGYAEYCLVEADYAVSLPKGYTPIEIAPLLCAGLIGMRAYKKANAKKSLGLYGFGSSAHIVIQLAVKDNIKVHVFTKPGDHQSQEFARKLGAVWAGASDEMPPSLLDAAIIFASVGALVPQALQAVHKGGRVVCAGIHMSNIPEFPYAFLWGEREIVSVANLTRQDAEDFMLRASQQALQITAHIYPLENVMQALTDLREGKYQGSYVLQIG